MRHTALNHTRGDYGYESYRDRYATRGACRWNGENIEGCESNIGERCTLRHENPRGLVLRERDCEAAVLERARKRAALEVTS